MNNRKKHSLKSIVIHIILLCILFPACRKPYTPKEYGYYRLFLPEHKYETFEPRDYPYRFEANEISVQKAITEQEEPYWINVEYPSLNAKIHCSYKAIRNNLGQLSSDAEEFVYAHAMKATSIPEHEYSNPEHKVYGLMYELNGNTASPIQFYLTDSIGNFFRGAVYFNCLPNQDSLAPVIDYLREDITHLIETFEWQ